MVTERLSAARAEAVWDLLARHVQPGPVREAPLTAALGLTLAHDATALHDYPPFDRSLVDGFAVRVADFSSRPSRLRRAGVAHAGAAAPSAVPAGGCVQINTGAPIPAGADAVIMVEDARASGDDIEFTDTPTAGQHIERRACLRRRGDTVVRAGTRFDAGALAALTAAGHAAVSVFEPPRVAIVSTGDELADQGAALGFGQIHDSNGIGLGELVRQHGGQVALLERCPDDEASLRAVLRRGLDLPVLCVVGGMSLGTRDLAPGILGELGVDWLVTSLDLKPGKPTRIGRSPAAGWVIGLPGNPVSCGVCFLLFGAAILGGLQGRPIRRPALLAAEVADAMPGNGARPMFQPGQWTVGDDGRPHVRPAAWHGSGDPFGLAEANCVIYRPERAPPLAAGAAAQILVLGPPA